MRRCFIYDDENLSLQDFMIHDVTVKNEAPLLVSASVIGDKMESYVGGIPEYKVSLQLDYINRKVELDPTTMMKIAKYNDDIELKGINEEIKYKKEELKGLELQIKKLEDMIPELKELCCDYMNSDFIDINDFLFDEYGSHDDYND